MRPKERTVGADAFECFGCGHRVRDPDQRFCRKCGSEMRHIGRARDL